jgi:hypothetical protein
MHLVWARLIIEEYEDGPWDELLAQLGFPLCLLHRGNYEIWTATEGLVDVDAAFECAIRFLTENGDRLRAIKEHLRNPMRLAFRYKRPLYVDRKWVACETTIPAELIRRAGELAPNGFSGVPG